MRIGSPLHLFSILLPAMLAGLPTQSVEITLERTIVYKNKRYATFDTTETTVLFLTAALEALGEEEPDNQELIRQAIEDGDFIHHPSYAYVYPPLHFHTLVFYQIPLYDVGITWLRAILAALNKMAEPGHQTAIDKIDARIQSLARDPKAKDKPGKVRQRAKAKRILDDEQVETDTVESELELRHKRPALSVAPAAPHNPWAEEAPEEQIPPWLDEPELNADDAFRKLLIDAKIADCLL